MFLAFRRAASSKAKYTRDPVKHPRIQGNERTPEHAKGTVIAKDPKAALNRIDPKATRNSKDSKAVTLKNPKESKTTAHAEESHLNNVEEALQKSQKPSFVSLALQRIFLVPTNTFKNSIADPCVRHVSGLAKYYHNSAYSIQLIISKKTSGEKITARSDIYHVMRNKRDSILTVPSAFILVFPILPIIFEKCINTFPSIVPSCMLTLPRLERLLQLKSSKRLALGPQIFENFKQGIAKTILNGKDTRDIQYAGKVWKLAKHMKADGKIVARDLLPLIPLFRGPHGYSVITAPMRHVRLWHTFAGFIIPLMMRGKLYKWADWIFKDSNLVFTDGVNSLSEFEVMEALNERCFANDLLNPDASHRQILMEHCQFSRQMAQDAYRKNARSNPDLKQVILPDDVSAACSMLILSRVMLEHK